MDGLMFDTGRLAYRAYLKSANKHNFELNHYVYYYLTGRTEVDIRKGMKELYGKEVPVDEWRDSMNKFKQEILAEEKRVYKKKGLLELLTFLKENKYIIALASSSSREKISYYLEIEGVSNWFDVIVAGNEVNNGKPNPEIFLTACKKSNILPEHALVLEDSRVGIEAARQAQITSFLIEDDISDLPIRKGRYSLKKNLAIEQKSSFKHPFQFRSLLNVKQYLQEQDF